MYRKLRADKDSYVTNKSCCPVFTFMGQIYLITNEKNGKIYVGQTSLTATKRWSSHKRDANSTTRNLQTPLARAIRKHGQENFVIKILEDCPSDKLDEREIYWIKELKAIENGYNLTEGGCSRRGYSLSEETKAKMSKARKGIVFTKEHKNKLSEAKRDYFKSGGTSWNAGHTGKANCLYGTRRTDEVRAKISESKKRTPVEQYDLNGVFIRRFGSILDACNELAKSFGKKTYGANIIKTCRGKRNKAYGFVWKYGVKSV